MNPSDSSFTDESMKETSMTSHDSQQTSPTHRTCIICGIKAIGVNFGAPTCAPCKAFFRRNARRHEILKTACHHAEKKLAEENNNLVIDEKTSRYLQIRRCTTCRLRRCFQVGMKEELVRTEEENQRHKQLVNTNRKRRELLKQYKKDNDHHHSPQLKIHTNESLSTIDWCHLSTIVSLYDNYAMKTFVEERSKIVFDEIIENDWLIKNYMIAPMSISMSLARFLKALPTFQALSRNNQNYLCKNNLRRLIFLNQHELKQSCFFEPWQLAAYQSCWQMICGPQLYEDFLFAEYIGEKYLIADPNVTRLWMVTLLFSTSLFSYFDPKISQFKPKKKQPFLNLQNIYITLLWKYLVHRHGWLEAIRIYINLVHTYLHQIRIGIDINIRLRTQQELIFTHETLDQLSSLTLNEIQS